LEKAAYNKGVQDGRQQEQTETAEQRQKERELIRHLGIELRALQQHPEQFFEPLKKLAMHVAEILVRNELQTSEQAIKSLIEACISQLDTSGDPVTVSLSPADFKVLQATGEATSLKLVEDPNLRPGSVKAQVQDTLVQDLIEHRLEPLARKILSDPDNWLQRSTLLHDLVDAMPDESSPRTWSRTSDDIVDMPGEPDPKDS
jgi:flagellar biosynthesis/type III secretory pathway protein FliH